MRRLNSRGTRAQLLRGMWDLPEPGLEPVSPTLAGGFLTTAPPGKPIVSLFTFRSLIHLQFILICDVMNGSNFIFIQMAV